MKEALIHPRHPERICWGCDRYCPSSDLACREERLVHPIEVDGYDWLLLEQARAAEKKSTLQNDATDERQRP